MWIQEYEKIGLYKKKHFTEYVEEVKTLKRAKKNQQAILLLNELIESVEEEANFLKEDPCLFYYEQLAILYRKEKQYENERKIYKRYLNKAKKNEELIKQVKAKIEKSSKKSKHQNLS